MLHVFLSLVVFSSIAFLLSENKKKINVKLVFLSFVWQGVFAFVLLKIPAITGVFSYISMGVESLNDATNAAMKVVFGNLGHPDNNSGLGFILALHGFPVLIIVSMLSSLLIYFKIFPIIIRGFSLIFRKTLFIGGTLGMGMAVNVFTGQSETPLIVRSYLKRLTRSELFSLMVCGAACTASSVMVIYEVILQPIMKGAIAHIIAAVLISIPGALAMARIIVPETKDLTEGEDAEFSKSASALDAISTGIMDGAKVMINIIAMLIGFIALVSLINQLLAVLPDFANEPITLQRIIGILLSPFAWIIGFPSSEMQLVGSILGTKLIFNEILAFQEFVNLGAGLSVKSKLMMIYALCSFANVGSIGVMIGVYGSLIPERKQEVIKFGVKAIIAGSLANYVTASIVGMLH